MASLGRLELQKLAQAKADDARLLFEHRRFSNAYYLFGYSVELALKACITLQFAAQTIPDRTIMNQIFTHRLSDLVGVAGLKRELQDRRLDRNFDANWAIVSEWSEQTRYESIDVVRSTSMRHAVEDSVDGVLPWLKHHW